MIRSLCFLIIITIAEAQYHDFQPDSHSRNQQKTKDKRRDARINESALAGKDGIAITQHSLTPTTQAIVNSPNLASPTEATYSSTTIPGGSNDTINESALTGSNGIAITQHSLTPTTQAIVNSPNLASPTEATYSSTTIPGASNDTINESALTGSNGIAITQHLLTPTTQASVNSPTEATYSNTTFAGGSNDTINESALAGSNGIEVTQHSLTTTAQAIVNLTNLSPPTEESGSSSTISGSSKGSINDANVVSSFSNTKTDLSVGLSIHTTEDSTTTPVPIGKTNSSISVNVRTAGINESTAVGSSGNAVSERLVGTQGLLHSTTLPGPTEGSGGSKTSARSVKGSINKSAAVESVATSERSVTFSTHAGVDSTSSQLGTSTTSNARLHPKLAVTKRLSAKALDSATISTTTKRAESTSTDAGLSSEKPSTVRKSPTTSGSLTPIRKSKNDLKTGMTILKHLLSNSSVRDKDVSVGRTSTVVRKPQNDAVVGMPVLSVNSTTLAASNETEKWMFGSKRKDLVWCLAYVSLLCGALYGALL